MINKISVIITFWAMRIFYGVESIVNVKFVTVFANLFSCYKTVYVVCNYKKKIKANNLMLYNLVKNPNNDTGQFWQKSQTNPFHLVNPSLIPLYMSFSVGTLLMGVVQYFHRYTVGFFLLGIGLVSMLILMFFWFNDIINEGFLKRKHTRLVRKGLRLGMKLFILSEVMFFFALFWAFFHAAINPVIQIGRWPPFGLINQFVQIFPIKVADYGTPVFIDALQDKAFTVQEYFNIFCHLQYTKLFFLLKVPYDWYCALSAKYISLLNFFYVKSVFNWYGVPLLNTVILLSSGVTVTLAHVALKSGLWDKTLKALVFTIFLGGIFTFFQKQEYDHLPFCISDSVYGSVFYLATGFHGFHVLIGTIFLLVCAIRHNFYQFTPKLHVGLQSAIWYWHFVDAVWVFLFLFIYIWGGEFNFVFDAINFFLSGRHSSLSKYNLIEDLNAFYKPEFFFGRKIKFKFFDINLIHNSNYLITFGTYHGGFKFKPDSMCERDAPWFDLLVTGFMQMIPVELSRPEYLKFWANFGYINLFNDIQYYKKNYDIDIRHVFCYHYLNGALFSGDEFIYVLNTYLPENEQIYPDIKVPLRNYWAYRPDLIDVDFYRDPKYYFWKHGRDRFECRFPSKYWSWDNEDGKLDITLFYWEDDSISADFPRTPETYFWCYGPEAFYERYSDQWLYCWLNSPQKYEARLQAYKAFCLEVGNEEAKKSFNWFAE